jgi:hypothetical protein
MRNTWSLQHRPTQPDFSIGLQICSHRLADAIVIMYPEFLQYRIEVLTFRPKKHENGAVVFDNPPMRFPK